MSVEFVRDWQEMFSRSMIALQSPEPIFFGRIGGSDTDLVIDYFEGLLTGEGEGDALRRLSHHFNIVERYNGYYDKNALEKNYLRYCDELIRCYANLSTASLVGGNWLTRYFPDAINPVFQSDVGEKGASFDEFLRHISRSRSILQLMPYPFVEKMVSHPWSLFNVFSDVLKDKRVMVISPFSRSITKNFPNRSAFFKNYTYPEFQLLTVNSPITYKGLPEYLYPNTDWFETVDDLKAKVAAIDFDIALMSCGSYAMPLGDFIANEMKKKALYVGGVLQLYFGIMGRRYQNPFFLDQINAEYFILADERDEYFKHVAVAPEQAAEGFGAYF